MDTFHIPGLATYIVKDGQCMWNCGYGYANLDDSIEVADTTLFQLESDFPLARGSGSTRVCRYETIYARSCCYH
jgi:hypothetical protein